MWEYAMEEGFFNMCFFLYHLVPHFCLLYVDLDLVLELQLSLKCFGGFAWYSVLSASEFAQRCLIILNCIFPLWCTFRCSSLCSCVISKHATCFFNLEMAVLSIQIFFLLSMSWLCIVGIWWYRLIEFGWKVFPCFIYIPRCHAGWPDWLRNIVVEVLITTVISIFNIWLCLYGYYTSCHKQYPVYG